MWAQGSALTHVTAQHAARAASITVWPSPATTGAVKARLCPNGWGDRLLSMLAFATLMHLDGAKRLLLYWPEHELEGGAFNAVNDYNRIAHHFVLAPGVRITSNWSEFVEEPAYWYAGDGPSSQDLWPAAISRSFKRPLESVKRAYTHVRSRLLKPSAAIHRVLQAQSLPARFIGLHLRRGDKVLNDPMRRHDTKYLIEPTDIDTLREKTWEVLPADGSSVLICSDDDAERNAFAARLGGRLLALRVPNYTDPIDNTFLEFFALSRASTVVLSQRWSTYSFSACLLGSAMTCDYRIAWPHIEWLQRVHRASFAVSIQPRLLHIVGCHCDQRGSTLPMPPNWVASFRPGDAVLTNACAGLKWPGRPKSDYHPHPTLLKVRAMHTFLQRIVAEGDSRAVVLFAEDDILGNFDGGAATILRRFDDARGNKSIVLMLEPSCWLSRPCTRKEMRQLYPSAVNYSRCPTFVNSGLYIGEAEPLLELVKAWDARTEPGDQERLVKTLREGSYSVHYDASEAMFATAMTVTRTKKRFKCTPLSGYSKGYCDLHIGHGWTRDAASPYWHRRADYQSECGTARWPAPLFIHCNGPAEAMLEGLRQPPGLRCGAYAAEQRDRSEGFVSQLPARSVCQRDWMTDAAAIISKNISAFKRSKWRRAVAGIV